MYNEFSTLKLKIYMTANANNVTSIFLGFFFVFKNNYADFNIEKVHFFLSTDFFT